MHICCLLTFLLSPGMRVQFVVLLHLVFCYCIFTIYIFSFSLFFSFACMFLFYLAEHLYQELQAVLSCSVRALVQTTVLHVLAWGTNMKIGNKYERKIIPGGLKAKAPQGCAFSLVEICFLNNHPGVGGLSEAVF